MRMKMKLRLQSGICVILIFLLLSGCRESSQVSSVPDIQDSIPNENITIFDSSGERILNIDHYGTIIQTSDGFIYSKLAEVTSNEENIMDYYHYTFSTDEHIKLGTVEDWVYEASYDSFCENNHAYILISTGDAFNFDESRNYLYDIDLSNNTMTAFFLENASSPYNSMALVDNIIYITMPGNGKSIVNSFDIESKKMSKLKEYTFNTETLFGDAIRHITADENNIYLLRLHMEGETKVKVFLDIFDLTFSPISSVDITSEITENTLETEDKTNEARQLVSHFEVKNNIVYYENFSISRALFEIPSISSTNRENIQSKHILEASPALYRAISSSANSEVSIFYEAYRNTIFVMDANARQIQGTAFYIKDPNYYITYMTHNEQGDMLIFLDSTNPSSSKTSPRIIYCVNISELRLA